MFFKFPADPGEKTKAYVKTDEAGRMTWWKRTVGDDSAIRLQEMAPGVIWVAALLAVLLSLDRLFKQDYEDGSLDQLMLSPNPLVILVLSILYAGFRDVTLVQALFFGIKAAQIG